MIRNLILDLGNVLIRFDPAEVLGEYDLSQEEKKLLLKEVFLSAYWALTDYGYMDHDEAFAIIRGKLPERLHDIAYRLMKDWYRDEYLDRRMVAFLEHMKEKGYGLYLLSNAGTNYHDYLDRTNLEELFDGMVISAVEKKWKPSLDIFELLVQRYGLKKEECVFIDDSFANVAAAIVAGMKGIVYEGYDSFVEELKALDIE